jgi:hypothetical protein
LSSYKSNNSKKTYKRRTSKFLRQREEEEEQEKRTPKEIGILIAIFLIGALLRTHGLFFSGTKDVFVGSWEHPDNLGNQWLFWGLWENISKAQDIWVLHNSLYYHPIGDSPWLAGNAMDSVFALPLTMIFGWPISANLYTFGVFFAIGICGFHLGQRIRYSFWSSIFLGCTIQSSTYLLHHANAGRFSQLNIVFLLLGITFFIEIFQSETWEIRKKNFWKLPVSLLFCGIGYWYYLWFFGIFAGCYTLFYCRTRQKGTQILMSAVASLLLCLPFLLVYLYHWSEIPGTDENFPSPHAVQNSLELVFPLFVYTDHPQKILCSEGITVFLFLGFLLLQKHNRENWKYIACWGSVALVGLVLSMGVHTPLYELIYGHVSVLQRFWWPSRHIVLYKIAIAILAAKGFDLWMPKNTKWSIRIAAIATPFCLMLQGLGTYGVWVSTFDTIVEYEDKNLPFSKDVVLIQPPLSPKVAKSQIPLLYQTFHHRKILTGHALWVDRVRPLAWDEYMREHDFFRQLLDYEEGNSQGTIVYNQNMHLQMIGDQTVILAIDPMLFPQSHQSVKNAYRDMAFQLFGQPVYQNKNVLMWDIRNWNGRELMRMSNFSWPTFVTAGDGNFPISSDVPKNQVLR